MVMQDTTAEEAKLWLEKFKTEIAAKEFDYQGISLKVTVSIGIAEAGLHSKDARTLFNLADDALYECKRNGRNQVRISKMEADAKPESKVG
jgi:diguanylate cyclase (GGDEF)-like protein